MIRKILSAALLALSGFNSLAQQSPLQWVNANAKPVDTTNSNNDYLPTLAAQLKNNIICGLAEASHGTHEFSAEKQRIIKYLIKHQNYRALGFEFGYSPMAAINTYVQTGEGDIKTMVKGLRLFGTKDMLALFQSIKTYNDTQPAANKVSIFGFDTDYAVGEMNHSAAYSVSYLRAHPGLYVNERSAMAVLQQISVSTSGNLYELADDDIAALAKLNTEAKAKPVAADESDRMFRKSVSLLYQGTLLTDPLARDKFMAENLADIQQESRAKTIIWSHNMHMAKDTTMAGCRGMGYYIRQKYGDAYYAVGFDTFKGSVTVLNDDTYEQHNFQTKPESLSAQFAAAKLPAFFIHFDNSTADPFYNITGNITNIYANWGERRTLPARPGIDFDSIIFFRETTATAPLE